MVGDWPLAEKVFRQPDQGNLCQNYSERGWNA